MGMFDNLGKVLKEKAEKNKQLSEFTRSMGEGELISLYKTAKRKGEILAMANASRELKERYYYTDEEIKNL